MNNLKSMIRLALGRIGELGQAAYEAHQETTRWRAEPLNDLEKTQLSLKVEYAVEEQKQWIKAIEEALEQEDE